MTAGDAEKALRAKELTLGQASPQPIDPKGKIVSQIPAAGEVVKAGTPVNIFYPDPADAARQEEGDGRTRRKDGEGGAGGAGGAGGGGGAAADIIVPAIAGAKLDAYAKKAADLGIVPVVVQAVQRRAAPARRSRPSRPAARRSRRSRKVKLLVSAGQPQVVYTNGKNILRAQRRQRRQARPGRDEPGRRGGPDVGRRRQHVAYTADGRVMLKDLTKKNSAARAADPGRRASSTNLAWAPTADTNVLAMDDVNDSDDTRPLPRRRSRATATDVELHQGAGVLGHPRTSTGRRTARSILGVGVKLPAGSGIFGIVRWKRQGRQAGVLARPGGLEQGPLRDRHRHAGQGRARRRGLAGRQAARAGLQPGLVGRSGCGSPTTRRTSRCPAPSRRRARLQGDLARRLPGGHGRPGRRGLRGGRRGRSRASPIDSVARPARS